MDSEQERLQDGTTATDGNIADINRKPLGGKRIRCRKGQKWRTVALEGLQPMVTEAFFEKDNSGLDAVKKSKEEWKFWIVMIIVFNVIGFAAINHVCEFPNLQTF